MKKIYIVVISFLILISTGCIKYNINMSINSDKSMTYEMIYALEKDLIKDREILDSKTKSEYEKLGFKISSYNQDDMTGFTLTKDFKNIDDISSVDLKEFSLGDILEKEDIKMFKIKKGLISNSYSANFLFNSDEISPDDEEDEDSDYSNYFNNTSSEDLELRNSYDTEFLLKINFPDKPKSNNATSNENDGKTLIWDLTKFNGNNINFEFSLYNMNVVYIIFGIEIVLLIGLSIKLIKTLKK